MRSDEQTAFHASSPQPRRGSGVSPRLPWRSRSALPLQLPSSPRPAQAARLPNRQPNRRLSPRRSQLRDPGQIPTPARRRFMSASTKSASSLRSPISTATTFPTWARTTSPCSTTRKRRSASTRFTSRSICRCASASSSTPAPPSAPASSSSSNRPPSSCSRCSKQRTTAPSSWASTSRRP